MALKFTDNTIQLRPIAASDIGFLKKVYYSTREKELEKATDWTTEIKEAFINQQFEAQHNYYQKNYLTAVFWVITKDKTNIGRLYIDEHFGAEEIRIIDITLLPNWRNKGLGQQILNAIISRAENKKKKVSIHVESFNPAMALYFKLGFKKVSETNGVYHLLEWKQ
jgi:ribosomal protein S18 acetylase RimI-like enzyme